MGHYSDAYDYEYEQERKGRKVLLEKQLEELKEFYMWKPDRPRMWSWHGEAERLFNQIIKEIKAQLYDLRDVDTESQ